MFGEKEFNQWINEYDEMVERSAKVNKYPFAGYYDVLENIYQMVASKSNAKVLDLGFGTGKLTNKLYEHGCIIYGQDFSLEMIELSLKKMPNAHLYKGDFSNGLVEPLTNNKYDYIISTYALHHLSNEQKICFINNLFNNLNDNGKIIIGDIMFSTAKELDDCRKQAQDDWDEEESYFVIEDIKNIFPNMLFKKISFCAGVLTIFK